MAKVIIPKSSLPNVSDELTNKLRFRIVNKNRNLYSEWSIIGEIKRDIDTTNFDNNSSSYSINSSISNRIDATWYTADINQEFDIYVRYKLQYVSAIYGTFSEYQNLQYLGRKNTNSVSVNRLPLSGISSPYTTSCTGVQIMVKLPEYPRIDSLPINITQFDRTGNSLRYWLSRNVPFSVGDYVNINLNTNTSISPFQDNSIFSGIKRVTGIGFGGQNTFSVQSSGTDIALRFPLAIDASRPNNVAKINGNVQFATGDISFT